MTEEEWLTASDPKPMLKFLSGQASGRKWRLFAVACCRRIWHLLAESQIRKSVEVAEAHADGSASDTDMQAAEALSAIIRDRAQARYDNEVEEAYAGGDEAIGAGYALLATVGAAASGTAVVQASARVAAQEAAEQASLTEEWISQAARWSASDETVRHSDWAMQETPQQAKLLREIFAPYWPGSLDRSWLTPNVINLASAIYEDRHLSSGLFDNQRLGVLADALEDAGCDNADILQHLRSGGEHVRGCWVVDLILGKR